MCFEEGEVSTRQYTHNLQSNQYWKTWEKGIKEHKPPSVHRTFTTSPSISACKTDEPQFSHRKTCHFSCIEHIYRLHELYALHVKHMRFLQLEYLFFSYWHEKVPSTGHATKSSVISHSVLVNHLVKNHIASAGERNQYLNWLLSSQLLQVANYLPFLDNLALFLHKVSNISTSNNIWNQLMFNLYTVIHVEVHIYTIYVFGIIYILFHW